MWNDYVALSNRRGFSQLALPVTLESISEYERHVGVPFTLWERRVLCRVDDAVVGLLNGKVTKRTPAEREAKPDRIPMTNSDGVKNLFLGIAAAKRKAKK